MWDDNDRRKEMLDIKMRAYELNEGSIQRMETINVLLSLFYIMTCITLIALSSKYRQGGITIYLFMLFCLFTLSWLMFATRNWQIVRLARRYGKCLEHDMDELLGDRSTQVAEKDEAIHRDSTEFLYWHTDILPMFLDIYPKTYSDDRSFQRNPVKIITYSLGGICALIFIFVSMILFPYSVVWLIAVYLIVLFFITAVYLMVEEKVKRRYDAWRDSREVTKQCR